MTDPDPLHQRHKPPRTLERPRELILACCPLRSNVNLSRILRSASCCGVQRVIACGRPKIDPEIARDAARTVQLQLHRTLSPVLLKLKKEGYSLVGLEQTTQSQDLHHFHFARRTVLVVGNERQGIDEETLRLMDATIEIPVYGLPYSYNVSSATDMALYEFCRQYPDG